MLGAQKISMTFLAFESFLYGVCFFVVYACRVFSYEFLLIVSLRDFKFQARFKYIRLKSINVKSIADIHF